MTDRKMERKTFPAFITKADEEQGIIEAVFAVFGNVDEGDDIVHPGAFTKTFAERGHKVKVLDNHRTDSIMRVIGKPLELQEIKRDELPPEIKERYPEATGGAFARIQMLMDTPEGSGAFTRLKNGAVDEWSFGYDTLDYDHSKVDRGGKETTVRNLRTLKLYEVSPVLWAMNPAAATTAAKASEGKPWNVFPVSGEFCVFKVDDEGNRMGESLGCHDTESAARQQVEALYVNESEEDDKAINLSQQVEDIRQAFHSQYNLPNSPWLYWVNAVYDEYLIITYEGDAGEQFYQINYQKEDNSITFAPRGEWIEGEYEFIPMAESSKSILLDEFPMIIARHIKTGELMFVWQDEKDKHHKIKESEIKALFIEEHGEARPSPDETPTSDEVGSEDEETPTDELLKLIEIGKSEISIMEV